MRCMKADILSHLFNNYIYGNTLLFVCLNLQIKRIKLEFCTHHCYLATWIFPNSNSSFDHFGLSAEVRTFLLCHAVKQGRKPHSSMPRSYPSCWEGCMWKKLAPEAALQAADFHGKKLNRCQNQNPRKDSKTSRRNMEHEI